MKPNVSYVARFFDTGGMNHAYGFSTLPLGHAYRTYFFSPTAANVSSSADECIYLANTPGESLLSVSSDPPFCVSPAAWGVYCGDGNPADYLPFDVRDGLPRRFQPIINHVYTGGERVFVGDPSVIHVNGTYLMLYSNSIEFPHQCVYGAVSRDGVTWSGRKWMWFGHQPSLILDEDRIRCWYVDLERGSEQLSHKEMSVHALDRFLDTSADGPWTKKQQLVGLSGGNPDVAKIGSKYFAVHDAQGGRPHEALIACATSDDGITFTNNERLASLDDIAPHEGVAWVGENGTPAWTGLTVPQLFWENGRTFLVAMAAILIRRNGRPQHVPKAAFLLSLDFGTASEQWIERFESHRMDGSGIPGFETIDVARHFDSQNKEYTVSLRTDQDVPANGYGGLQLFPPPGKRILGISCNYVTNYNNADIYAAITLPGSSHREVWKSDVWGETVGQIGLGTPRPSEWVGFGLFSKRAFRSRHPNWVFRISNLRIYYQ